MESTTHTEEPQMETYRVRMIDRLARRATQLQTAGRWEEADNLLSIAVRYEALWAHLDGR